MVFHIELSNHNIAQTIAEETGAKAMLFYSCQTITRDDFEAGESYLSLMRRNVAALKEAKVSHDALERVYNPYVDFEGVRTLAALESGRLLSYLK